MTTATQAAAKAPSKATLTELAKAINKNLADIGKKTFATGALLIEGRALFDKGVDFLAWSEEATGLKKAQTYKLIKIASIFADDELLQELSTTVLYSLTTASESTLEVIRTLVEACEVITNDVLLEVMYSTGDKKPKVEDEGGEDGNDNSEDDKPVDPVQAKIEKAVKKVEDKAEKAQARITAQLEKIEEQKDVLIEESRTVKADLKAKLKESDTLQTKLDKALVENKALKEEIAELKATKKEPQALGVVSKRAELNEYFNIAYQGYRKELSPVLALAEATKAAYMKANDTQELETKGKGALTKIITPLGELTLAKVRKELGLGVNK